jgi:uncharacterized integral membrane protein (TIGR00698 family)
MTVHPRATPPGDDVTGIAERRQGAEALVLHETPPTHRAQKLQTIMPGLLLAITIAGLSFALHRVPTLAVFSPMIIAAVIGMVLKNTLGTPATAVPGIKFSLRLPLRIAIVLLGFQLTLSQIMSLGWSGLLVLLSGVAATFIFTVTAGRLLGVDDRLSNLIAAGTSICGASAILAANTVVKAEDEDIAYALGCITIFGSLGMLLYPLIAARLALEPTAFGLWAGASIHEIGQVVATSFQGGQIAGETGTIAKLTRVLALAPVIVALAAVRKSHAGKGRPAPAPWFVVGFAALVVVNTVIDTPPAAALIVANTSSFLFALALGAMGLETDWRKLNARGARPLALGALAFLFISLFSLGLIELIGA